MRVLVRFASLLFLVVAILAGTVDAIQSVSASEPVLTPLATALAVLGGQPLAFVQMLERSSGGVFDPVAHWVLRQPAFAFFLAISLLLWVLAYRRPPLQHGAFR